MVLRVFLILLYLLAAVIFTNCGEPSEPETPVVTLDTWDAVTGRVGIMYLEKQSNGT